MSEIFLEECVGSKVERKRMERPPCGLSGVNGYYSQIYALTITRKEIIIIIK